jgi:hypothetical protein
MQRFLIEHCHAPDELACARAVKFFLESGSHFLSHADWGCNDGVHCIWYIVEVDTKDEARMTVPVPFRADAKIVALNTFTMDEIDEIIESHQR